MGENGVGLTGSTVWVDGRNGLQPRQNRIEGNIIYRVGLYTKQSCGIFLAVSCQNIIRDNIIFHGPRALINLNDGFGGDSKIDRNLLFAAVLETKDHGPFNSWDRLPYLTNVRNGSASLVPAFNHLTSNLFFSGSPFAIDTDDGSDWLNVSRNVVYKQPLFKLDYGGHSKQFSDNVALYGGGCIHSNIAPRSPNGPEHCHFSSPCADKDATTTFAGNKCVGAPSAIRCTVCRPGIDCAAIRNNSYYVTAGNGSEVCNSGGLERGSHTLPLPSDAEALAMVQQTLEMGN